jgi:drug/metabolite transporter (DMT)-like permease
MTTALGLALFSVVAGSMLAARSTVEGGSVKSTPRVEHLGAPEVGAPWVRGAGWGLLSAVALGISFFGLDFLGGHGAPIALTVGSYRLLTALGLGALTVARGGVADAGSTDGEGHGLIGSLGRWTFLGLLDAGGMLVYAWGCARGEVAVVAVVASLFPALTVSLAHWRMGERLSRWQWVGLGWMFAGLIAVAWLQGP